MAKTYPKRCDGILKFRRYRTTKTGKLTETPHCSAGFLFCTTPHWAQCGINQILDARLYGLKAWPICEGCWVANEKTEVRTTSA